MGEQAMGKRNIGLGKILAELIGINLAFINTIKFLIRNITTVLLNNYICDH